MFRRKFATISQDEFVNGGEFVKVPRSVR